MSETTSEDVDGVTSVEPGCTCGGVAACPQCQERDYRPKNQISDRWYPR